MEYGWLSLVPPIVAIGAAYITKKVVPSLLSGILIAALIVSDWSVWPAIKKMFSTFVDNVEVTNFLSMKSFSNSWNLFIILYLISLGIIIALVNRSGGALAYGEWAAKKIKSKKDACTSTMFLGILIFFDDYFNSLTVGTVMKPITDKFKVSRAKLAYLVDSTAAPIVILAPVSGWVAEVLSQMRIAGIGDTAPGTPFGVFMKTVFLNSYAWMTLLMVFLVARGRVEYGPMKEFEDHAHETADVHVGKEEAKGTQEITGKGRVSDLVLPIAVMFASVFGFMLQTGGYTLFGGKSNFVQSLLDMNSAKALFWGGMVTLAFTLILFLPRKLFSLKEVPLLFIRGFNLMRPALVILVLAWTIGSFIKSDLGTGNYIASILSEDFPVAFLPAIFFLLSCLMAFSTGTSWGTFGIMIPIAVPLAVAIAPEQMVSILAAILGGAVYGDHSSPISDTTILSSTGSQCNHIDHVRTQFPYATTVASVCLVGYIILGFTVQLGTFAMISINILLCTLGLLGVLKVLNKKNSEEENNSDSKNLPQSQVLKV